MALRFPVKFKKLLVLCLRKSFKYVKFMKTNFFLALLLFLSFSKIYSQNEDFTYVTSSTNGEDYSVLIKKIDDYSTEIWVKNTVPIKSRKTKSGKIIKTGGGYKLTFMSIKCGDSTYDLGESIAYDKNGNVTSTTDIPSYDKRVVPGSVMSAIYDFVCSD